MQNDNWPILFGIAATSIKELNWFLFGFFAWFVSVRHNNVWQSHNKIVQQTSRVSSV